MTTQTDNEINHLIATKINNWVHDEGVFYHNANGDMCCIADYCNSISHALDLAKAAEVALVPTTSGWLSYPIANSNINAEDIVPGKAICLCILKMFDDTQAVEATPEASN
jgi:hypothetical protein